jgi:hypothetical protein
MMPVLLMHSNCDDLCEELDVRLGSSSGQLVAHVVAFGHLTLRRRQTRADAPATLASLVTGARESAFASFLACVDDDAR